MSKEALLFPGQGISTLHIRKFYEKLDPDITVPYLSKVQDALNEIHGSAAYRVKDALTGASSSFERTEFYQPLVCSLGLAAFAHVGERLTPAYVAGHSLGEWTALMAAGGLDAEEGITAVAWRGRFMQQAADQNPSGLVSINGLSLEEVINLCQAEGVSVALINAPKITVIGCSVSQMPGFIEKAELAGAMTHSLKVAGAFHTKEYMMEAAINLEKELSGYKFKALRIPVVTNLTGDVVETGQVYTLENLVSSMVNPVQWVQIMETLKSKEVEMFTEVGPGGILQYLCKFNNIPLNRIRRIFTL